MCHAVFSDGAVLCFLDADVPIERISRLVGHSSTVTTESIYCKQLWPVIEHGADVMDRIFPAGIDRDA